MKNPEEFEELKTRVAALVPPLGFFLSTLVVSGLKQLRIKERLGEDNARSCQFHYVKQA